MAATAEKPATEELVALAKDLRRCCAQFAVAQTQGVKTAHELKDKTEEHYSEIPMVEAVDELVDGIADFLCGEALAIDPGEALKQADHLLRLVELSATSS